MLRKILIADDEPLARERIRRLLSESGRFEIREAANGLEALDKIPEFEPDIVFLDIQMPGLTGFEVLKALPLRKFQLIFQTAYDEFALSAFEENACDYLLKPYSQERFDKALKKALARIDGRLGTASGDGSDGLLAKLHAVDPYLRRITFKHAGKTRVLAADQVIYFLSQDHVTCARTIDGAEYILDTSLAQLETQLDPKEFTRAHRNSLVALAHVKAIGPVADPSLELSNGEKIDLSRSNRSRLAQLFARA